MLDFVEADNFEFEQAEVFLASCSGDEEGESVKYWWRVRWA